MNFERAAKLILMLSSPNENEVLAAAHLLTRMGIHEIAEIVRTGGGSDNQFTGLKPAYDWHGDAKGDWFGFGDWQHVNRPRAQAAKARHDALEEKIDQVFKLFLDTLPEVLRAA